MSHKDELYDRIRKLEAENSHLRTGGTYQDHVEWMISAAETMTKAAKTLLDGISIREPATTSTESTAR